jgi:hypothetical protein
LCSLVNSPCPLVFSKFSVKCFAVEFGVANE